MRVRREFLNGWEYDFRTLCELKWTIYFRVRRETDEKIREKVIHDWFKYKSMVEWYKEAFRIGFHLKSEMEKIP